MTSFFFLFLTPWIWLWCAYIWKGRVHVWMLACGKYGSCVEVKGQPWASMLTFYIVHHGLCQDCWPSVFWRFSSLWCPSYHSNTLAWQVHVTVFTSTWTWVLNAYKASAVPTEMLWPMASLFDTCFVPWLIVLSCWLWKKTWDKTGLDFRDSPLGKTKLEISG